jgi:RHS repeat-associated protein
LKLTLGLVVGIAPALVSTVASAQAAPFSDSLVQPPELAAPSRGSIAGQYASIAFGPGDVSRGAYALPLPVTLPTERGAIGASFVPSYSPDAAISEWGAGWSAPNMTIYRSRVIGDLDYVTDERTGPWGRMVKGADGAWYPVGLKTLVRVEEVGPDLVAHLPDGAAWTFTAADGVSGPGGTFAWSLKSVVTVLGRTTSFAWSKNASGRPFLTSATWGGTDAANPQYQATFDYAPTPLTIADYRAGRAVLLDQRIQTVHALVKETGSFVERYRFDLTVEQDGGSPTFYLASLQQTFAGGAQPPPVKYGYLLSREYFAQASGQHVPKLDALMQEYGADVFLPNKSSAFDANLDGRPDLEFQFDNRVLRQTDSGFEVDQLPILDDNADPLCRRAPNAYNTPRALARMRAGVDDVDVVALVGDGARATTGIAICDRAGISQWQASFVGDWTLGSNTRLADLNRDHQPDLVRVYSGGYQAMPNTGTATTFGFGPAVTGALVPAVAADTSWIHDINGDGIPDIVSRVDGAVVAWMGEGNLQFDPQGKAFAVVDPAGRSVGGLQSYQFVFFDANNDGITDLLLSDGSTMMLFANSGNAFVQVDVPFFASSAWASVIPVVLDVAGNGNTEIAYVQGGQAYAVDLDAPGVGLLTSADDGRGTVVQFGYQRAAPEVGVRYRNSLLGQVQVLSTGYDAQTYQYVYGKPDLHSVGRFLLGYEDVARNGILDSSTMAFSNTDVAPGVLLSAIERDTLAPSVERVTYRRYEDAAIQGVPWRRLQSEGKGWSSTNALQPSVKLEETEYLTYVNDVCPEQVRVTGSAGVLATTKEFVTPAAYAGSLACIDTHITMVGAHADASLDFRHEAKLARNDLGQIMNVTMLDASGAPLDIQDVTYGTDRNVATMGAPARGTSTYAWTPSLGLLASVTAPDGVVTASASRDPLTDAILELTVQHGPLEYTRNFRFDGQERLAKTWNDLGAATEAMPNEAYSYRDANGAIPALTQVTTLASAGRAPNAGSGGQQAGGYSDGVVFYAPGTERCDTLTSASFDAVLSQLASAKAAAIKNAQAHPGGDAQAAVDAIDQATQEVTSTVNWLTTVHVDGTNASAAASVTQSMQSIVAHTLAAAQSSAKSAAAGSADAGDAFDSLIRAAATSDQLGTAAGRCYMDVETTAGWEATAAASAGTAATQPPAPPASCDALGASALDPLASLLASSISDEQAELAANPGQSYDEYGQFAIDDATAAQRALATLRASLAAGGLTAADPATAATIEGTLSDVAGEAAAASLQTTYTAIVLTVPGPARNAFEADRTAATYALRLAAEAGRCSQARPSTAPGGGPSPLPTQAVAYSRSAYVATAAGEALALAHLIPEGWAFEKVSQRSRATRQVSDFTRGTVSDVTTVDVPSLYASAQQVKATQSSLFGYPTTESTRYHADVERDVASAFALGAGGLAHTATENGQLSTVSILDERDHVTSYQDQAGGVTAYVYDALGRVRRVILPDGAQHRVDLDAYGRPKSLTRDGVATITYAYDATSGLLAERDIAAPAGTSTAGSLWRRVQYAYDAIGREALETDVDARSGATQTFQFFRDGATPLAPDAKTALGFLTAVVGDRYSRTMTYRPDGLETDRVVQIDGWRTIENRTLYEEDGAPLQHAETISDASGAVLASDVSTVLRDPYGRTAGEQRDGAAFVSYGYDVNGLPLWATFTGPYAHEEAVTLAYDPTTRQRLGLNENAGAWSSAFSLRMNARGLVDYEDIAVSTLSLHRTFDYSPQGFLTRSADPGATYVYAYGADGLPSLIQSTSGAVTDVRTFARSGNQLTAGTHQERFDDIGRVVERDGITLTYGPNGQIAEANVGSAEYGYLYDEAGNRVAKLAGNTPIATYLPDGSYLDATSITTPLRFANQLVGVLRASVGVSPATKQLRMVATDLTGTVLSDEDGSPRLASPFGDRANHPSVAAAIDYAAKGYDADLGVVRMGVRDYDPTLSRFLTPDPLFLEDLTKAIGSPVEANLYGYAKDNPLKFADATGLDAVAIVFPDYKITVTKGHQVGNLGHAGVLLIDNKTGAARYYEYGRYGGPLGKVQTVPGVPTSVVIGKDGTPTQASLKAVLSALSSHYGHQRIEGAYIRGADFKAMEKYARGRIAENSDPKREPYGLLEHNCASFMKSTVEAGGKSMPSNMIDRPNGVIKDVQDEYPALHYTPSSGKAPAQMSIEGVPASSPTVGNPPPKD